MNSWPTEVCRHMYQLSLSFSSVLQHKLSHNSSSLTLLCAPSLPVYFSDASQEPLLVELATNPESLLCIQHDPTKTMLRLRDLGSKLIARAPEISQPLEALETELPTVSRWEECQVSEALHQYACEETSDPDTAMQNIYRNIIGHDYLKFPYVQSSVVLSLARNHQPVLVDVPEPLLRINTANSLTLHELRDIHQQVEAKLQQVNRPQSEERKSGNEVAHEMFPEVFQKPRDLYVMAMLKMLAEGQKIIAVVSAPSFVALKCHWEKSVAFAECNRCLPRRAEDSDENLVEKHAILDAIMNTKTWNDRYMKNRFIYVDRNENLDADRKLTLKKLFHKHYTRYNAKIADIMAKIEAEAREN
jgi:hypothetical protein